MSKEIVGLKIGASHVTAARVARNGNTELLQTAQEPLASGMVQGGEVRDARALAEVLKTFFKKYKLPKKNVRVGIANNRIGVRMVEIVGVDDPMQLENAVRFRAQEALPIPIQEAVLDYQVLAESMNEEGESTKQILLVVAYKDLVESLATACREAGLRLIGVDLEAFALLRALAASTSAFEGSERSALVAVTIGAERTTLAVSEGSTCEYTRVLEWGGAVLTQGLAQALELELPMAERLKRQISLEGEETPADLTPEQARQAREALQLGLQSFARELVSSLQFYQSQSDSLGIKEIVLAGGTANLSGLDEVLHGLIGVPVQVGDPAAGISIRTPVRGTPHDPSFAVPIGLGMGR